MMRCFLRALSLAALPAVLPACSLTQVHETVHRTVPSVSSPMVRVSNGVGAVKVLAWDKPVVDIVAVKDAHSTDDLQHISVNVKASRNDVSISTSNEGGGMLSGTGVGYTITVPAGSSLDIDNTTGGIRIAGVRGDVSARSTTGGIEADLGTVNGKRNVDMRVTTGGIVLAIAQNSSATADLQSRMGGVTNAFGNSRIGDGSARIHLETTVGGVALRSTQNN